MKRKHVSLLLALTLILSALVLASCSEAEPLPEGVSALPDLDASELTASLADETGEIQWPAELLPEGFPVPKYEEIYSVEREDNEVRIVLLSKQRYGSMFPDEQYMYKLASYGFVFYMPKDFGGNKLPGFNRDGWRVLLAESRTEARLAPLAEKYGYAYEINVRSGVLDAPESLFWEYPDSNTDLGYESRKLDEWPADLLPENVPMPDPDTIVSMEVRPNGVFITVKYRVHSSEKTYENMLYEAGYYEMSKQPHRDKDGNYFYVTAAYIVESDDGGLDLIQTIQFCKYNDTIIK